MMPARRAVRSMRVGATGAAFATLAAVCFAQSANHLADPPQPPPSRWSADVARIDDQLRLGALVVDDPRGHWVAGHFDTTDIASRVRHYAAARVAAPRENLYLASLAMACQQPVSPTLPECDTVDRLADWASRDADNGVPLLVLAAKAARRGNNESAAAFLEQAAASPRIDDYWSRGWLEFWVYVTGFPVDADPAAKAEAAAGYAAAQPQTAMAAVLGACPVATKVPDALRAACGKAGIAMAERGTTFASRSLGEGIAERNAAMAGTPERARTGRAAMQALNARCGALDQQLLQDAESPNAATRGRAVAALDRSVRDKAALGEVAACERRASR
jgi:hypothetical protein